jgi:hypothetical protein
MLRWLSYPVYLRKVALVVVTLSPVPLAFDLVVALPVAMDAHLDISLLALALLSVEAIFLLWAFGAMEARHPEQARAARLRRSTRFRMAGRSWWGKRVAYATNTPVPRLTVLVFAPLFAMVYLFPLYHLWLP